MPADGENESPAPLQDDQAGHGSESEQPASDTTVNTGVKSPTLSSEEKLKSASASSHVSEERPKSATSHPSSDDQKSSGLNRSQTQSRGASESPTRPKSNASGEIKFEAKPKSSRKKKQLPPDAHKVTFTVTIALAFPTVQDDDQPDMRELIKKKKRVVEAPRAQNYYHCEYYLLPTDTEPVKTDIVTFGMAAKLYTERQEPRVLKTWQDGDQTWVSWTHSHNVVVTDELLCELYKHRLELRIWDTKEKCSTRARFDRPKAFRLPQAKPGEDADDIGGVKTMVIKQSRCFLKMQPRKSYIDRPLPSQTQIAFDALEVQASLEKTSRKSTPAGKGDKKPPGTGKDTEDSPKTPGSGKESPTPTALVAVPSGENLGGRSFSRLGKLAGVGPPKEPKEPKPGRERAPKPPPKSKSRNKENASTKASTKAPTPAPVPKKPGTAETQQAQTWPAAKSDTKSPNVGDQAATVEDSPVKHSTQTRPNKKAEAAALAALEHTKKYGVAMVPMRMAEFFAGKMMMTTRLEKPVPSVDDVFLTVLINEPLLSEEQTRKLNPLIITVNCGKNMPAKPLGYEELSQRCSPVYTKYKFFDQPDHCSMRRQHGSSIYWDDINVFLAGTMDKSQLRECLLGPPLTIEVHDRDREILDEKLKPALFGDDLEDEKISNVGTVASRRTVHNAFSGRDKPWDPHGIAKFDLSGLLLGQKMLSLKVPIQPCANPDLLGLKEGKQDEKLVGIAGAVDGPVDSPTPAGHYFQSGAALNIKVTVAHALTTPEEVAAKPDIETTEQCPFGRIVFMFDYRNTSFLQKIQTLITEINAKALALDKMPLHVIQLALSTYKLSREQQASRALDIVTGFQVMDGIRHVFILEGLREGAIRLIWESLPKPENSDIDVLYHNDMSFSSRLYGPLDVDLCRIKLHEPLHIIIQQSLLYVRDMVPRPCFLALTKLYELIATTKLRHAISNDLFPTAGMVVSMSREFGVPLTSDDFEELQPKTTLPIDDKVYTPFGARTSRTWTPIDNFNDNYENILFDRDGAEGKDFIIENKNVVKEISDANHVVNQKNKKVMIHADVTPAHNYSTQHLNSTELAKEKLRQELAKHPDHRFTYCHEYQHSMTVVPVNVEEVRKHQEELSRSQWRTDKGWVYPGVRNMIESNVHPRKPVEPRIDELKLPWVENTLHTCQMQPTLENRQHLAWDMRHADMNLWKKPPENFGNSPPITIHLAGEKLYREQLEAAHKSFKEWIHKIVVDDLKVHNHRCLPETEMRNKGFKSSNQLDSLQGIRKDPPKKHSLKKPGMYLEDLPPLSVVLNPSVDTATRLAGKSTAPAVENEGVEKIDGFGPGPFEDQSWVLERNKIPLRDYEHKKYDARNGKDFNVYHKERRSLSKRPIQPLTSEEYGTHLFKLPQFYPESYVTQSAQELRRYHPVPPIGESANQSKENENLLKQERTREVDVC
ncbi:uncharacterized protein LOC135491169 isoform X2 [Lineus longissimus]|uniref:uncharacterized protein LOC135491169 isoform X2 n=1 Tax=Lineus longissimus TaxID=88925 RepID=UPI002B4E5ED3